MAGITLTGIQASTSLDHDITNAKILEHLNQALQHGQDANAAYKAVAALFLQRGTTMFSVFVDSDQKRTLADVVFMGMLALRARFQSHRTDCNQAMREVHAMLRNKLRSERLLIAERPQWNVATVDRLLDELCNFLSWYQSIPFGKPKPCSFDYLSGEERNAYIMYEQKLEVNKEVVQDDSDEDAEEKDEEQDSDVDDDGVEFGRRSNLHQRLESMISSKNANLCDESWDSNETHSDTWFPLWRIILPLQSSWLIVHKSQQILSQHVRMEPWNHGHKHLLPYVWQWVNIHPGHHRMSEARDNYFHRLVPGGRKEQMLRFVAKGYSGISIQNVARMALPLVEYTKAVKRAERLPRELFLQEMKGDGNELNIDEENEDLVRARLARRVARILPADKWDDLHISWIIVQFDSYLRDSPGISFVRHFLYQRAHFLEKPFFWTGQRGESSRVFVREPIILEDTERGAWAVSVAAKNFVVRPSGRKVYQETLRELIMHECSNFMDALQCWISCMLAEPFHGKAVDEDGAEFDLRDALRPLAIAHPVSNTIQSAIMPDV
jgi:hypothetical protein